MSLRSFSVRCLMTVALVVGATALTGCQTGGGEPMGVRGYSEGRLTGNVPGDVAAVTAAVMQELVAMGVLNAEEDRSAESVEIRARTLEEVPLQIRIERLAGNASRLIVQVGANETQARALFGRVRTRLNAQFN